MLDITEVRVTLRGEERLKAFVNITISDSIVIRGLKVISGPEGLFVSMPARKRSDGSHQDIAHPVSKEARRLLEEAIMNAYEEELGKSDSSMATA